MAYDIGPKIGIEGEKEFRDAITSINTRLKTLDTEMQAVTSAYNKNDTSVEKLTAKQKVLTQQVEAQRKKLLAMSEGLEKSKEKYGENNDITQKWQQQVNRATAKLNELERELDENSDALEEAKRAAEGYSDSQEDAAKAAEKLEKAQREAADRVAEMSDKLQKSAGTMKTINTAALAAAGAVAGLGTASAKVGMDFEAQMSKVGAISGATAEDMEVLTAKAQEMGATTKFTATESGQALEYMAMAGWKTADMVDGLEGIMNLAAASGEELGTTSDIVTDALTAFGLSASDSSHFADVLAVASSNANTNVSMMGETFKYAAPVAGALGYSVEDVAVAIGVMANAGIKGEQAGTALRGALTNLAKPSDENAMYMERLGISMTETSGEAKPLNKLITEMRKKFAALTETEKAQYAAGIAGKNAMSGFLALMNGSDADFKKLTTAIERSDGAAKNMAKTMNDNLKGQLTLLGSAAESVGIAFYDKFSEPATEAIKKASEEISKFSEKLSSGELDGKIQKISAAAITAGTAIGGMNAVLMAKDIANFATTLKTVGLSMEGYTAATKAGAIAQGALNLVQSLSPMGALAIAAGAVATGLAVYANMTGVAETETDRLSKHVDELTSSYNEYQKTQDEIAERREFALSESMAELNHVQSMAEELRGLTDENGKVKAGYEDRARVLSSLINDIMPNAVQWAEQEGTAYATTANALQTLIEKEELKAWLDANQEGYQAAVQGQNDLITKITELDAAIDTNRQHWLELEAAQKYARNAGNIEEFDRLQVEMDETSSELKKARDALNQYEEEYVKSTDTITQYEAAKAALLSDDEATIRGALEQTSLNLKSYTGNNVAELQKQAEDAQANYETLIRMSKAYPQAVTENQLNEAKKRAEQAKIIAEQAGAEETAAQAAGVESKRDDVRIASENTSQEGADGAKSVRTGYWEAGEYVGEGFAQGIESKASRVYKAGTLLGGAGNKGVTDETKIASPSKVMIKAGMWFDVGLAKGIEDNSDKAEDAAAKMSKNVLKAANDWISDQKFYNRLAIGDEVDFWRQMLSVAELQADELAEVQKKLYTARKNESKESLEASKKWIEEQKYYGRLSEKEELEAWRRVVNRKNLLADEQIEAEKELYSVEKQIMEDRRKLIDQYAADLEARASALSSYAGLFDEVVKDREVTGGKLLQNLQDQVDAFKNWQDDMEKLAGKGITGPLLDELKEMGPSAASQIHALSTMTKAELEKYAALYEEKANLIAEQAAKDVGPMPIELKIDTADIDASGMAQAVATLSAALTGALTTTMQNKSASIMGAGSASINSMMQGMTEASPEMQQKIAEIMDAEIKLAESYKTEMQDVGLQLMQGVAQGIRDGKSGVVNEVRRALEAAAEAARAAMDINSPSKVFAEIGDYMAQGIGVGFVEQMRAVARQIADSIPVPESPQISAYQRASEATVNGIAAAMQGGGVGDRIVVEVPVYLDGREVTRIVADHLPQVSKQRGVTYG